MVRRNDDHRPAVSRRTEAAVALPRRLVLRGDCHCARAISHPYPGFAAGFCRGKRSTGQEHRARPCEASRSLRPKAQLEPAEATDPRQGALKRPRRPQSLGNRHLERKNGKTDLTEMHPASFTGGIALVNETSCSLMITWSKTSARVSLHGAAHAAFRTECLCSCRRLFDLVPAWCGNMLLT
jgi:hypothetical protein